MALDTVSPRSRRALLFGALGAGAAAVAATLERTAPARAGNGLAFVVRGVSQEALHATQLDTTATTLGALSGIASSNFGVSGSSATSSGVVGTSTSGTGVSGTAIQAAGTGVFGQSPKLGVEGYANGDAFARGVRGHSGQGVGTEGASTSNVGVYGSSKSYFGLLGSSDTGVGAQGQSTSSFGVVGTSTATNRAAVLGRSDANSTGVIGASQADGNSTPASLAKTGVYGYAPTGRGVVAVGGKAQLRLVPSAAGSHPGSGSAGDLFVDSAGRLSFCKGGNNWVLLA